jgi:WD40 repeat protein
MRRSFLALSVLLAFALCAPPARAQQPKRAGAADMRLAAEEGSTALKGHDDGITALAFSPDGKILASGSGDRTIILWDPHSGKMLRRLEGHTAAITSLSFSPDGRYLASTAAESAIVLWNTTSWQIDSIYNDISPVCKVCFLTDSQGFVTYTPFDLSLWQVGHADPKGRRTPDTSITALTVASGDIYYGDGSGTVALWDGTDADPKTAHHRPRSVLDKRQPYVHNWIVGLSPGRDGHVLVGDRDGLWDWNRETDQLSFLAKQVFGKAAMLDHDRFFVAAYERRLWLRESDPTGISVLFKMGFPVHALAASPAGDLWAYGGRGDWLSTSEWHRGYPSEVRLLQVAALPHAFELSLAEKNAAHEKAPKTPLDATAVTPDLPPLLGWDQPSDLP